MNEEEWGSLVTGLERQAEANPRRYARKVLLFGLLGYAVLGITLLILVGLAAVIVYLAATEAVLIAKLLIPLAGLGWVIVQALGTKIDPPKGFSLSASDAPELHGMIDDMRRKVRGPRVDRVLIDGQFNASIVQIPRLLGLLGQQNYLILGLPYMQASSPDEFRAVVAHELGHLSRNHGRVSSWIYRIHATWWALLQALEQQRRLSTALFRRFFIWYQPRFEAYSFPLRRLHEYDADKAAADAAGAEPAASSLVTAVLNASYLDTEYWPHVYARANDEPRPPAGVFRALPQGFAEARKHPRADAWIANALARPTAPHDSHPSIAARIERLGFEPNDIARTVTAGRNGSNAADAFLGPAASRAADYIDTEWRSALHSQWAERHKEVAAKRNRLSQLGEQAKAAELTAEEAAERCYLTEDVSGPETALPLWEELLRRQPGDGPTIFAVARLRLAQGDATGLELVDRLMEVDEQAIVPACELAYNFLMEQRRTEEAEAYERRAVTRLELLSAADAERAITSEDDELVPADLPDEVIEQLRERLAETQEVRRAYLVQKRVEHLAEFPLYIIVVIPARPFRSEVFRKEEEPSLSQRLMERIELPVDFHILVPGPRNTLRRRIAAIPGAKIYER